MLRKLFESIKRSATTAALTLFIMIMVAAGFTFYMWASAYALGVVPTQ